MKRIQKALFIFLLVVVLITQPLSNAYAGDYWENEIDVKADFDSVTDGDGDMNDHADAAHDGATGLEITFDDANVAYGTINADAVNQTSGVVSFWFNKNDMALDAAAYHQLLATNGGEWYIYLTNTAGTYQVLAQSTGDTGGGTNTALVSLADGWNKITMMWKASSGAGNDDGWTRIYVNDVLGGSATGLDNDTKTWDYLRAGMIWTNSVAFGGSFYMDTIKIRTDIVPIVMGDSSVSDVPAGLKDGIEDALNVYRPDEELEDLDPWDLSNMWAVTGYNESDVEDYYWVSVTGMVVDDIEDLDGWNLAMSLWSGIAVAQDNLDTTFTAHLYGSAGYDAMLVTAGLADISFPDEGGTGSATYYFPWYPGTLAYYGTKGIHTDVGPDGTGYGGMGWVAVDWVGGTTYADNIYPNAVYASQSGTVSFVCIDSVQTWVQIGNFLYGHLNDNETLREGEYHSQGGYLGSLITGSHSTNCGGTDQRDTSYHLHIGFLPDGDYFQWEDWVLDARRPDEGGTEEFRRGDSIIRPSDYMLAEWKGIPIVPTPGPTVTPGGPTVTPSAPNPVLPDEGGGGGGQIFDGFIAGVKILAQERVNMLNDPDYQTPDMPGEITLPLMLMSGFRIAIRSVYVLLKSNLNLTISLIVFGIVLVLEPIRVIRALWIGIKEMVPFL